MEIITSCFHFFSVAVVKLVREGGRVWFCSQFEAPGHEWQGATTAGAWEAAGHVAPQSRNKAKTARMLSVQLALSISYGS